MVTTVYLMRHCEAQGNLLGQFQGSADMDITEKGARQLECLAQRMKDVPLQKLYSSPKIRAQKTAQAANRYHNLAIEIVPGVTEIDGGDMEGHRWDELPQLFPLQNENWVNYPWKFEAPHGERMVDVYNRMRDTILDLVRQNKGLTIGIASHGCAIKNFLCFAMGLPLERIQEVGWSENTAVSCVTFDENLHPTVVFKNDSDHLPPELYSMKLRKLWPGMK